MLRKGKGKLVLLLMFFVFLGEFSVNFAQGYYYFHGKVTSLDKHSINVSGKVFKVASDCKVSIQNEEDGAFFEKPASWEAIKIGDWVTVKVIYDTVYEILIERYKR